MNYKQRACLYGISTIIGIRIFFLIFDYYRTNGHTEELQYIAANAGHNYLHNRNTFSWSQECVYDFTMLIFFVILLTALFMSNILSWIADKKNKNKEEYEACAKSFQNKIETLNRFYQDNSELNLDDSLSPMFKNKFISILIGWANNNMKKVIKVESYKPIKVVELFDNHAKAVSFQSRKEFLEYNGKPLKKQETETIWQHILYEFQKIDHDWKIVGFKNQPTDSELFNCFLKK